MNKKIQFKKGISSPYLQTTMNTCHRQGHEQMLKL